jgi:hypothetical protein
MTLDAWCQIIFVLSRRKSALQPASPSAPLVFRVSRRGRLDAKLEGSSPVPHPMETWGRVWSTPVPPLDGNGPLLLHHQISRLWELTPHLRLSVTQLA